MIDALAAVNAHGSWILGGIFALIALLLVPAVAMQQRGKGGKEGEGFAKDLYATTRDLRAWGLLEEPRDGPRW